MAEKSKVELVSFNIIYRLTDWLEERLKSLLPISFKYTVSGQATVLKLFTVDVNYGDKMELVAGCKVDEGTIKMEENTELAVLRNKTEVYRGKIKGMRHLKKQISSATKGMECGIIVDGFRDIKEDDILQCILSEKIEPSLD